MSINFIGNKNKYFVFSIFLIVLITVATIINGVGLDIQFQGGYIFTYSYEGEVDKDKLETEIEKELNKQVNVKKTQDLGSGLNKIVVSFGANIILERLMYVGEVLSYFLTSSDNLSNSDTRFNKLLIFTSSSFALSNRYSASPMNNDVAELFQNGSILALNVSLQQK